MITWIKAKRKLLIALSFPYLYLLFALLVPTSLSMIAPGGLTNVESFIQLDDYTMNDDFYTVYVYSYHPVTAFQQMAFHYFSDVSFYKTTEREKDTSLNDSYKMGQLTKKVSLQTSIIKAYELASIQNAEISIDYVYSGAALYYRPSRFKDIEIGDRLIAIDGFSFAQSTHDAFLQLFYSKTSFKLTFLRETDGDDLIYDVDYHKLEEEPWMTFYPMVTITHATPAYTFEKSNVGGPSGGLIQSLSLYASLLNINFENIKIAGTGTIEMDGTVGRIGGIVQKLYTAKNNKVDVFFMPKSHETEVPNINFPFQIYYIETLEEAVKYIHDLV